MTVDNDGTVREWCPKCRRMRVVVDEHEEVGLESGYMRRSTTEVGYWVTDFECGHSKQVRSGKNATYHD